MFPVDTCNCMHFFENGFSSYRSKRTLKSTEVFIHEVPIVIDLATEERLIPEVEHALNATIGQREFSYLMWDIQHQVEFFSIIGVRMPNMLFAHAGQSCVDHVWWGLYPRKNQHQWLKWGCGACLSTVGILSNSNLPVFYEFENYEFLYAKTLFAVIFHFSCHFLFFLSIFIYSDVFFSR